MTSASKKFTAGFSAIALIAAFLNLLPYLRTRGAYQGDGFEIIGFPLTFRTFGGFVGAYEFHISALLIDIGLALIVALLVGYVCSRVSREMLQFWERRRLLYNAVLAFIVLLGFVLAWPRSTAWFRRPALPFLIESALLANLAYCAAYVVELVFHFTRYRERWPRWRTALFIAGVLLASGLAVITVGIIWLGPMSN